jgi:hypothetical protein
MLLCKLHGKCNVLFLYSRTQTSAVLDSIPDSITSTTIIKAQPIFSDTSRQPTLYTLYKTTTGDKMVEDNLGNEFTMIEVNIWSLFSIWAASRQNQHSAFATSSLSVSLLVIELVSEQHGSWSDCADAQAGLDPCWSQTHYVGFVMARLISYKNVRELHKYQ